MLERASGFFDTRSRTYLQNQFGATLGGPIKKDETFFFVTYEGDRIRRGTSSDTVTVPTAAERLAIFRPAHLSRAQSQTTLLQDF